MKTALNELAFGFDQGGNDWNLEQLCANYSIWSNAWRALPGPSRTTPSAAGGTCFLSPRALTKFRSNDPKHAARADKAGSPRSLTVRNPKQKRNKIKMYHQTQIGQLNAPLSTLVRTAQVVDLGFGTLRLYLVDGSTVTGRYTGFHTCIDDNLNHVCVVRIKPDSSPEVEVDAGDVVTIEGVI
jgi:hypothetical protein